MVALEWLDPPYAAGHWTPQLIEYAGGEDVLGFAGEKSEEQSWELIAASQPDIVIVMPCGFDAEIAHREAEMHRDQLAALGAGQVVAVDAASYFSRPGPRIIEGLELLAHILHPELVAIPDELAAKAIPVELSTQRARAAPRSHREPRQQRPEGRADGQEGRPRGRDHERDRGGLALPLDAERAGQRRGERREQRQPGDGSDHVG